MQVSGTCHPPGLPPRAMGSMNRALSLATRVARAARWRLAARACMCVSTVCGWGWWDVRAGLEKARLISSEEAMKEKVVRWLVEAGG